MKTLLWCSKVFLGNKLGSPTDFRIQPILWISPVQHPCLSGWFLCGQSRGPCSTHHTPRTREYQCPSKPAPKLMFFKLFKWVAMTASWLLPLTLVWLLILQLKHLLLWKCAFTLSHSYSFTLDWLWTHFFPLVNFLFIRHQDKNLVHICLMQICVYVHMHAPSLES